MLLKKLASYGAIISAGVALTVALGWSALPTNAGSTAYGGKSCPKWQAEEAAERGEALENGRIQLADAKGGTCSASKAAAGTCPSSAKNASLAKGEKGGACADAKNASLAKDEKGGTCADKAAGTCPSSAKNASLAKEEKGACCADGAAKQVAAKDGACADGSACEGKDIAKLVTSDSRFTTLALAVKAAGMSGEFTCPDPKTVLAPTNEAFQKIPAEQWAAILQDDAKLKALVANHIIKGAALKSGCLAEAKTAKSAGGADLAVSQCPVSGKVSVNNAGIVGDAMVASNGNVLAIDNVLLPADMQVAKAEAEDAVQVAAAE
ncbi:MAG: fasciclin domain-containing protein [Candidatus Hydrogenedentes bacterium]|nr:fasciclin domain-containing protein [Candidatus Hydrogenedentota bacterium]